MEILSQPIESPECIPLLAYPMNQHATPMPPEEKLTKVLKVRRHVIRESDYPGYKDCDLPANKNYSFDNYLTSVSCHSFNLFNFALCNGEKTNTGVSETIVATINPPDSVVRRVSVWCGPRTTCGI